MSFLEAETLQSFLDKLSSRAPTPGGGSACALVGAIGAALCGMVGRLNDKKTGEAGPLHDTTEAADELLGRLGSLVAEDMEAFEGLMASWKISGEQPAQLAEKQSAVMAAAETPLMTMTKAYAVMKLARIQLDKSKKNCVSDAGVAAIAAHAALEGARLNVLINLPGIADEAKRAALKSKADKLRADAMTLRAEIDGLLDQLYS